MRFHDRMVQPLCINIVQHSHDLNMENPTNKYFYTKMIYTNIEWISIIDRRTSYATGHS